MNKKFLLLLIPITTLVLSGCGKRTPSGSTSGDDPTTGQPTTGAPTSGTTGGSSGTTGSSATSGSSTTGSTSGGTSSTSGTSSTTPVPATGLRAAYEAALALPSGSSSTSSYTFEGVITGMFGNSFNVQDGEYGMYVYVGSTPVSGAAVGKRISITATVKNYSGMVETNAPTEANVLGDGVLPTPVTLSSKAVLDATKQNVLANALQAEYVSTQTAWTGSANGLYTFKLGSDSVTFKFDKYSYDAAKLAIFSGATPGDKFNFTNIATTFHDTDAQVAFGASSSVASAKELDYIDVTSPKTDYLQGDTFVKPTVTAYYDDSTSEVVTEQAEFSGYNLNNTGPQTVTVSFGGQTTTYGITVAADELTAIAVTGDMSDKEYRVGDSWDPSGLIATGTYTSGPKVITGSVDWSYSPAAPALGIESVVVTATLGTINGSTTVEGITVSEEASSLQIAYEAAAALATGASTSSPYTFSGTVVAIVGNTFVVQDGSYGMYVYNKAVTGNAVGKEVSVTATLKNYRTMFETDSITSATLVGDGTPQTSANLTSLASLTALNQNLLAHTTAQFVSTETAWASGTTGFSTFKIGGDNVKIKFDRYGYDADKAAVLSAATAGDVFNLTGLITSKFDDDSQLLFMGTSSIAEVEKEIDSISIYTHPTMLNYVVGDHFDPTGFVIDVLYDDDSHEQVPYAGNEAKFSFSPSLSTALTAGDTSVAITYGGKTANESISVVEDTLQEIVISGDMTKKSYSVGDSWDPSGLVATGNYNISGAKVLNDVDWAYSPETAIAGTTSVNVTASKAGVTSAVFTVSGITVSAAEEHTVSWTPTSNVLGSAISTVGSTATGNISTGTFSWNYTRTLVYLNGGNDFIQFQGSTWIQMGSAKSLESLVFTTSNIPGTIKSVSVVCATAGSHAITIDVGGTKYLNGASLQTYSGTANATNPDPSTAGCTKTGTGTSSGTITITLASSNTTTAKALLVRSITVIYEN